MPIARFNACPDRQPRDLAVFLSVSLVLHAAILFLWRPTAVERTTSPALTVTLAARPAVATPPSPPLPQPTHSATTRHRAYHPQPTASDAAIAAPLSTAVPAPATPRISLDAAFSAARAIARAAPPTISPDTAKPALTVEAAVARATQRRALIETHGANGEYVTVNGNTRCVTPLQVPHYMSGMPIPTRCEVRKG